MVANNLANAGTEAFKADREFYGLYRAIPGAMPGDGAVGEAPVVERAWIDFSRGTLRPTGEPNHLALGGEGFFAVNGPSGALYTRSGRFQISADGEMLTPDGYALRFVDGAKVTLQAGQPYEIDTEGRVVQNRIPLGQLELVQFSDPTVLSKYGRLYFVAPDGVKGTEAKTPNLQQGRLEESNVGTAESSVQLVNILRQFEMLQRAITMAGEMNRKAIEEVARVSG